MSQTWTKTLFVPLRSILERSGYSRGIVINTGWLFADRIVRLGMGLLVGVWVARYLGPEQYGLYSYAIAFVALFGTFATFGLDGIVVRDIVRDPSRKDETLGTTFVLKLIGGVITFLVTLGLICLIRPDDSLTRWLVAIIAFGVIFQSFDAMDFWFQSQVQSKYTVYAKNAAFIIMALVKLVMIWQRAPLIAFAWASLAEIVLGAIGLVIVYQNKGQSLRCWLSNRDCAIGLLKDSWPLVLAGMAVIVYMRIDVLLLEAMAGDKAVGIYAAATRISELWYFIPTAIVSSVFPSIIESRKTDGLLYYQRLQELFDILSGLALVITIPITLFSTQLVVLLFGQEYAGSGIVLAIHIWAALFVFMGLAQSPWNIAEGLTKLSFQRALVGAVLNVVLNIILIPTYASVGSAIATAVSYAVSAFLMNATNSRTRSIFFLQLKSIFVVRRLFGMP